LKKIILCFNKTKKELNKIIVIIISILLVSCINPFAPSLSDAETDGLGDLKTIDGFFQTFQYAYNMKDTIIYSNLLSADFVFAYRDYEKGINLTLTREEDMITTYRLFSAAQKLDFIWNAIIINDGSEIERNILRSFSLTITFPNDIPIYIKGNAYFILKRGDENENWKLSYWRDDSYY